MTGFLLANENLTFTIAVGVMLALCLVEVVTFLFGFALSGLVDSALPDTDFDASVDLNGDGIPDTPSWGAQFLGWLHVGDAPALILLMLFLLSYGALGWGIQGLAWNLSGRMLPALVAVPAALAVSFVGVRLLGGVFVKIMPREETTAISADELLGKSGVITLGTARSGSPSQAKLRDQHGQSHYVLVEPLHPEEEFPNGARVALIKREGPKYYVVEDSIDALLAVGSADLSAENRPKA